MIYMSMRSTDFKNFSLKNIIFSPRIRGSHKPKTIALIFPVFTIVFTN